jgi:hypothetical protein
MRRVTDECGSNDYVDAVMKTFSEEFRNIYNERIEKILSVESDSERPGRVLSTRDFGGVRTWLENNSWPKNPGEEDKRFIVPIDEFGIRFDDFKHYRSSQQHQGDAPSDTIDLQVRWTRHPHSWTYTLIESPARELSDTPNHAECPALSPGRLTEFLLTAILNPSVATTELLPEIQEGRRLAGRVLAGAHYLMVRVEDLMAFSCAGPSALELGNDLVFDPDIIGERIRILHRPATRSKEGMEDQDESVQEQARRVAVSLESERHLRRSYVVALLDACMAALGPAAVLNLIGELGLPEEVRVSIDTVVGLQAAARRRPMPLPARTPAQVQRRLTARAEPGLDRRRPDDLSGGELLLTYLQEPRDTIMEVESRSVLGEIVRAAIAADGVTAAGKAEIHRLIADLTRVFWHATFRHTIDKSARGVGDDFVGSAMADGRCVYFSNFMPFGDERFTRTIFVDIELGYYQRARVLQRLSDILTYRSVPLHDFNRVTTAIDSLIDMNRLLNDVQMKLTDLGGARRPGGKKQTRLSARRSRLLAVELQDQLDELLKVSVRAGRLNDFFTYGIAGKTASAEAYYEQIVERTQDIREERILGYALLSDFLTRRLKHSIRFIERMNMHHVTVSQRTQELLERVRTELDSLRAFQLVDGLEQQVHMTRVAEILVVVGGTYYTYTLLKPLLYLVGGPDAPPVKPIVDAVADFLDLGPNYRNEVRDLCAIVALALMFLLFTRLAKYLSRLHPDEWLEQLVTAMGASARRLKLVRQR